MVARHPTFPTRSRRAALAAALVLALSAHGAELFVPELFYARVPDRAANEDLVTISVEAAPAEGPPGACALSVRSDEDDVLLVVEYAVAVASGDSPCSLRLSCRADPVALEACAPGLTDLAGRPSPDAAARLRPLLEAADPRLDEALLRGRAARPNFQQISNNCTPRSVVEYHPVAPRHGTTRPRPPEKSFKNRERFGREMRL